VAFPSSKETRFLHHYTDLIPPELWVNEIGVAPSYRNQGIGRQLLQTLFIRGRELGCIEAWLGTQESNTAARRMYAAVGGKEEPMVYVTFPLTSED
jgi:aminoglycoside 6'-N-acetyltransferase I